LPDRTEGFAAAQRALHRATHIHEDLGCSFDLLDVLQGELQGDFKCLLENADLLTAVDNGDGGLFLFVEVELLGELHWLLGLVFFVAFCLIELRKGGVVLQWGCIGFSDLVGA
jgi:hypothetical protein